MDNDPTPDICGEWTNDLTVLSDRAYLALKELQDAIANQMGAGVGSGCLLDVARRRTLELMRSVHEDCYGAWPELRPDPELPLKPKG